MNELDKRFDEELQNPLCWYWLSFATAERFLGVACVEAPGPLHAIDRAARLGINPGGEVAYQRLPKEPPPTLRDNLVTSHNVLAQMIREMNLQEQN